MGIFGFTRKAPAGITGTTIKPERKAMSIKKKAKKSKYPKPVQPLIVNVPLNVKSWTKDALLQNYVAIIAESNTLATKLAGALTECNNVKVDLKIAKAKIKSLKTAGAK